MATEVTLPALGESVTEGTVTSWLKSVGDEVSVDEPLLEVSTDKVDTEIPSPVAGTLLEIRTQEDETVEVGAVLAVIGDSQESSGGSAGDGGGSDAAVEDSSSDSSGTGDGRPAPGADDSAGQDTATQETQEPSQPSEDSSAEAVAASQTEQGDQPSQSAGSPDTDEGAHDEPPSEQAPAARADAAPSGGDATEVKLPALGESVTEGTVTSWLKSVGDEVSVDEPLLEVSTDKVDTEIPSPVAGTLLEIRVQEDETVDVGAVLALIGSASGAAGDGGGDGSGGAAAEASSEPADEGQAEATQPAAPESDADSEQQESATDGESSEASPEAADEPAESVPSADGQPQSADQQDARPDQVGAPSPQSDNYQQPEAGTDSATASDGSSTPARDGAPAASDGGPDRESDGGRSYVTPLVRKLAAQHDVDLSSLTGTGVGGRIRKQDVLEAAAAAEEARRTAQAQPEAPAAAADSAPAAAAEATADASSLRGRTEKLSRLRKVIAARMVESLQTSAQLTTVVEVDVTAISRLRERVKGGFEQREGVKLSFLPFFAKAAVDALKTYPQVNASINTEAGTVTYHDGEHLGVAVDTERGLLVPVIKGAGDLSIAGLARKIADLAARTRDNKIGPDELSGGTFTLTNTGSRGALFDTPIINQPQVAILGTGTVVKRAVVISDANLGETIAIRQMVYLALTYDHRLVDGADAARFLTAVKTRLEEANFESELGV